MKLVIAIIQPHKLDSVREALSALGVEGMTVTEVRGYGRQKGHKEVYRGAEYTITFVPKLKIEVAVTDERADAVIAAIREGALNRQDRRRQNFRRRSHRCDARAHRRNRQRRAVTNGPHPSCDCGNGVCLIVRAGIGATIGANHRRRHGPG